MADDETMHIVLDGGRVCCRHGLEHAITVADKRAACADRPGGFQAPVGMIDWAGDGSGNGDNADIEL